MARYNFKKSEIEDILILEPIFSPSKTGYAFQTFSMDEFSQAGIDFTTIEEEQFVAPRGLLSGLHFQRENPRATIVRVVSGTILCVAVDLRPDSRSYGASHSVELSAENNRLFYIPEQFALGYLTLEANTQIICKYSSAQHIESKAGIKWDDQILAIDWQFERYDIDEKRLNISKQDKKWPTFRMYDPKTLWL